MKKFMILSLATLFAFSAFSFAQEKQAAENGTAAKKTTAITSKANAHKKTLRHTKKHLAKKHEKVQSSEKAK